MYPSRYLHGAPLELNFDNVEVIVKFASWYGVTALFSSCLSWLESKLLISESSSMTFKRVMQIFKLSNCLSAKDSAVVKDLALQLIMVNRSESFWTKMIDCINVELTGFDIVEILSKCTENYGAIIVMKWVMLSLDHKNFVLNNASMFNFTTLFPDEELFTDFISLLSDESSMPCQQVKVLLKITRDYFKKGAMQDEQKPRSSRLGKSDTLQVEEGSTYANIAAKKIENEGNRVLSESDKEEYREEWESECQIHPKGSSETEDRYMGRIVYIGNIPLSFEEREFKQLFSGFGKIAHFDVPLRRETNPSTGYYYAFLTYENAKSAANLLKSSRQKDYIYQGNKLKIHKKRK